MATLWDPSDGSADGPLRVEALPLVGKPVVVETTKAEMRRLVQRMRGDSNLVDVSNRVFRRLVGDPTPPEGTSVEWESFCGDVLVLYCARHVLDGRGVPVRT
jgi:hypothetical protein